LQITSFQETDSRQFIDIGPTGLFGRPICQEQADKVPFQVPASQKNGRQTLRAAKSSLFTFGSPSPQNFSCRALLA
jgi:hypothetical protein